MILSRYKEHYKAHLRLALPIALSQLGYIVVQFADNAMVGTYGGDDPLPLSAVSFGVMMSFVMFSLSMGICLGMQMLLERSFEYGEHEGLGLLKGQVVGMSGKLPADLKIPHMGWNALTVNRGRLLAQMDGQYVYFVHSFFADGCEDSLAAVTEYGIPITAAVEKDNIFGCQFHPEKSGNVGLNILRAFAQMEG